MLLAPPPRRRCGLAPLPSPPGARHRAPAAQHCRLPGQGLPPHDTQRAPPPHRRRTGLAHYAPSRHTASACTAPASPRTSNPQAPPTLLATAPCCGRPARSSVRTPGRQQTHREVGAPPTPWRRCTPKRGGNKASRHRRSGVAATDSTTQQRRGSDASSNSAAARQPLEQGSSVSGSSSKTAAMQHRPSSSKASAAR